jgi:hypothetical protein
MTPSETFRKHATECGNMAHGLRDPASRAMWTSMAARWMQCAQLYENQLTAAKDASREKLRRRSTPQGSADFANA